MKPWIIIVCLTLGLLVACSLTTNDSSNPQTTEPLYLTLTQVAVTLRAPITVLKPTDVEEPNPEDEAIIEPANASLLSPSSVKHKTNAYSLSFLPEGNEVVLLGTGGLATFDLSQEGLATASVEYLSVPMTATQATLLSVARDREVLAWVNNDKTIYVWNSSDPGVAQILAEYQVPITGMTIAPSGEGLVVSTYDSVLRIWGIAPGQSLQEWKTPSWLINLSYSPDKKYLAGVDPSNFRIYIYDAENGQLQRTLEWLNTASPVLYGAYFSPDWKKIAWIARGSAQLMDVDSGSFGPLLNHEDFISAVSWSPDGHLLATAAAATVNGNMVPVVVLWDASSGAKSCMLSQSAPIISLAFSPDGKKLAILDNNGELQTWSVNR